jgi:hypothetical protein
MNNRIKIINVALLLLSILLLSGCGFAGLKKASIVDFYKKSSEKHGYIFGKFKRADSSETPLYLSIRDINSGKNIYLPLYSTDYSGEDSSAIDYRVSTYAIKVKPGKYQINYLLQTLIGPLSTVTKKEYRHIGINKFNVNKRFQVNGGDVVYIGDYYGDSWRAAYGGLTRNYYSACCSVTSHHEAELSKVEFNFNERTNEILELYPKFKKSEANFKKAF